MSTAYRWIKSGKLKERYKTVGQHRRFCEAEVRTLFLSDKVEDEKIHVLVIHHKDRLLRFGSELIFKLCHFHGIKIVMMEDMADKSFEENLSADVIELMTVFCARL